MFFSTYLPFAPLPVYTKKEEPSGPESLGVKMINLEFKKVLFFLYLLSSMTIDVASHLHK